MAERIGGSPYGQLVQQLIFARLGGHGAPATSTQTLAANHSGQNHREVLLRDLEEMTIREIARRLTISGEAAKSLLRRARAAARQHLTKRAT